MKLGVYGNYVTVMESNHKEEKSVIVVEESNFEAKELENDVRNWTSL